MKRLLGIAAVVAVLGVMAVLVGGAVTSAQEGEGPLGTFIEKLAAKLGIGEDELKTAIEETHSEMIDEGVVAGRLTEEQAERLRERLGEDGFPFGWPLSGMRRQVGPHFYVTEAAVEVLGTTRDELSQQLRDGDSLAEVAEEHGMSVDEFSEALLSQVKAQLDALVGEGKLTQEQADEEYQRIEDNIDNVVNGQMGPGGFGGPGMNVLPAAAAQALGITQDELMEELSGGKSLAEVAEGYGMSVDEFSEALLSQAKAQLDALVAEDKLTQEQADAMLERIEENIDSIVSGQGVPGGFGGPGRGPGGFGFGGWWQGPPPNEAADGTEASEVTA